MDKEKRIKKKKLFFAIFLGAILVGSTAAVYTSINQQPQTETINPSNETQFVNNVMKNIVPDCYLVYTNPTNPTDHSMSIRIYNNTKDYLVNTFQDKVYTFLQIPATKLWFFNHCGFFDNSKVQIPNKYNSSLAVWNSTNKDVQMEQMKAQLLTTYDFGKRANSETNIDNLMGFYFMTYNQVVAMLAQYDMFSQDGNCDQVPHAHKGVLFCHWKNSKFLLYNVTGMIAELPDNATDPSLASLNKTK